MLWVALALVLLCAGAQADPWAAPGDVALRQDIELLNDSGALNIPITTWPMSWGDIAREIERAEMAPDAHASQLRAMERLRLRARRATAWGYARREVRLALADNPRRLRSFENTPRANAEVTVATGYTGERFSGRIELTAAASPEDQRNFRLDGSYVGVALGNTTFNFGLQEKWWGPGWDGALALSTNARPIPGLLIKRNFSDPFGHRMLKWIGPWNASFFFGELESSRGVPNTKFVAGRVAFRPIPSLELGLTRTAQWGGDGRDESLDGLFNLFIGRDNVNENGVTRETEPGNQMAGYDWRWRVRKGTRPVVFYGQLIGEDEAGGLPSRFLGQLGLSFATPIGTRGTSLRVRGEFSDTTCQFYESSKIFNCAYTNSLYPTGYRYRGRPIGHSTDNDARQVSVGADLMSHNGDRYSASLRVSKLNRGGNPDAANSLTATPSDLINLEFSHERQLFDGQATFGVGMDAADSDTSRLDGNDFRAFIDWKKRF